jgi:energy-converting hydrogenase Eha subunit H
MTTTPKLRDIRLCVTINTTTTPAPTQYSVRFWCNNQAHVIYVVDAAPVKFRSFVLAVLAKAGWVVPDDFDFTLFINLVPVTEEVKPNES